MARSRRNCISMRDVTYIALRLYKEQLNEHFGTDHSITGLGQRILQGEAPPIPKDLLKKAGEVARISREKRAIQDKAKKGKAEVPFAQPPLTGEDSLLSKAIQEEKVETTEDDPDDSPDGKHYGGFVSF